MRRGRMIRKWTGPSIHHIPRINVIWMGLIVISCFITTLLYLSNSVAYIQLKSLSTFLTSREDKTHETALAKSLSMDEMHEKWIVVTSISAATKDIEILANISGWKVVIVGDLKTPSNWSYPGCSFLSMDQQPDLGYKLARHLPSNSYTRKNLGYLYAIQHGARYIYDTDDDNHPTNGEIKFYERPTMSGLMYVDPGNSSGFMNPYAHFGQPTIWPRGYPLELISHPNGNTYRLCTYRTPAIQQGLVNGDPDVDAIFRLTRKTAESPHFDIEFDHRAPPVLLSSGTFAPFNSQNTFFTYDAFWALFLPSSVAFRVTDIWRGYWAQKLLWLTGHRVAFVAPNAIQIRNSHRYLDDFKDESLFYLETVKFVHFLKLWTCPNATFFACVSQLSRDMVRDSFWGQSDAILVDLWLSDLKKIGYKEPRLNRGTAAKDNDCVTGHATELRTIFYSPVSKKRPENQGYYDLNMIFDEFLNNTLFEVVMNMNNKPRRVFDNVLLVVLFNFPFFRNIPVLDALYRDHFPNMIYCGETDHYENVKYVIDDGQLSWKKIIDDVSFINITMEKGFFGYECAIRAMQMNYNVDGYLMLGDDVLMNLWNLYDLDTRHAQLQVTSNRYYSRFLAKNAIPWRCWRHGNQRPAIHAAFQELETISKNGLNDQRTKSIKQCLHNRYSLHLNMTTIAFGMSDFYYIPQTLAPIFAEVAEVFLRHGIFLELAVPTAVTCLQDHDYFIEGFIHKSIWFTERLNPMQHYKQNLHCFHPLKLSEVETNITLANEYTDKYLSKLLINW